MAITLATPPTARRRSALRQFTITELKLFTRAWRPSDSG
jgi:hypothetical protein